MSKKVVSAMLAFLLFVSNFMVSPVLAKENAENLSSESNICEICQQAECENTHENWCAECKQDDCDVEHGVQPDSLEQELQLIEVQEPAVEEQEPEVVEDVNPLIGKPVKFIVSYPYLWKDPSNVYDQIISNASVFPEVIYIEDVVAYSETITLYKLSVKGNNQWPSSYDGYYYVESTNVQIVEVQPDNICEICGTKDCVIEHVYCDYCKKYDCKVEHAICDACGNVDCQIQHVWCESCNKYDCKVEHVICDACGNVDC